MKHVVNKVKIQRIHFVRFAFYFFLDIKVKSQYKIDIIFHSDILNNKANEKENGFKWWDEWVNEWMKG